MLNNLKVATSIRSSYPKVSASIAVTEVSKLIPWVSFPMIVCLCDDDHYCIKNLPTLMKLSNISRMLER